MASRITRAPASDEASPFDARTREYAPSPFRRISTRATNETGGETGGERGGETPRPVAGMWSSVPDEVPFDGTTELLPMADLWPVGRARTVPADTLADRDDDDDDDNPMDEPTHPGLRPAAMLAAEAREAKRGEIGQLLQAIPPFFWSLQEAERWARELADRGEANAATHARSLGLLAKILAQLQARIDELQKLE